MMSLLRGSVRFFGVGLVLVLGAVAVMVTAWMPVQIKGVPLCAWPLSYTTRMMTWIFGIHFTCVHKDKFRTHRGLVFPNHLTFLDIMLLMSIVPVRFLSAHAIRRYFLIGWLAQAIGTVFVNRQDKGSRQQARETLTKLDQYPPIVIFPEGGILKPMDEIKPLRYGAFDIAVSGQIPYLPCVFVYDRLAVVFWDYESVLKVGWRIASRPGPIRAKLVLLPVVHPQTGDDPQALAQEAQRLMADTLARERSLISEV